MSFWRKILPGQAVFGVKGPRWTVGGVKHTAISWLEVRGRSDTFIWHNLRPGDEARARDHLCLTPACNMARMAQGVLLWGHFLFCWTYLGAAQCQGSPLHPASLWEKFLPFHTDEFLVYFGATWLVCVINNEFQIIQRVLLLSSVEELHTHFPVSSVVLQVEAC